MLERTSLGILNHLLQDATWARSRLAPFAGHTLRFTVPPAQVDLTIDLRGQFGPAPTGSVPEVEILMPATWALTLPLRAPAGLLADQPLFSDARIVGSEALSETLRFVLNNLRWDYEEDLAQRVGDIAAHRIAGFIKTVAAWQQQTTRNLQENIAEYLVAERRALVGHHELVEFASSAAHLQEDLTELERRIARLEPAKAADI